MAYKCRMCNVNQVDEPDGICQLCAVSQDPYAGSVGVWNQDGTPKREEKSSTVEPRSGKGSGTAFAGRKILLGGMPETKEEIVTAGGTTVAEGQDSAVPIYQPGQTDRPGFTDTQDETSGSANQAASRTSYLTKGIIRNVTTDVEKDPFLLLWFRALFWGIPIALYQDLTMFQVFPDYTGQTLTARGTACDQVIVYGTLKAGVASENNEVEVYGIRDKNNNIVATRLKNVASGATIRPQGVLSAGLIRAVTSLIAALICTLCLAVGLTGVVWVIVLAVCLMQLPLVIKIFGVIFSLLKSIIFH